MADREHDLTALTMQLDKADTDPESRMTRGSAGSVLEEIRFHAQARYWQFTPTHSGSPRFTERLWDWLTNQGLTVSDQETLLRSVPMIQFVDRDDMLALYRAAYDGPISRWQMDQNQLDFSAASHVLEESLRAANSQTWFCPITDSMDIAQFCHANKLSGGDQRPCWRTLKTFGDTEKIKKHMDDSELTRIVLLEDFVGSGTQACGPLKFAGTLGLPVLFVPLIVSEIGLKNLQRATQGRSNIKIEPVFVLPKHVHVLQDAQSGEPTSYANLRRVITETFDVVKLATPPQKDVDKPFGFNGSGTLIVLYTNCPNNTVPLYWHEGRQWKSLFPRISRA